MRRFYKYTPLLLLIPLLLLLACGGGGGDKKSPFELLQDRVSTLEASVGALNMATVESNIAQLRLDLDAVYADVANLDLVDSSEEIAGILETLVDLEARLVITEANSIIGESGLYCRPLNMIFIAEAGGSSPNPQTLTVGVPFETSWYAFEGESWLAITPVAGTESATITVVVDSTGLPAGAYYATIAVITVSEVAEVSITLAVLDFGL